ncbi:hypothetical protein [Spirosoma jeollabukense]
MQPLNQADRAIATRRFIIFYTVSLLVVLGAAYLLFSAPGQLLKQENDRLKATMNEQARIIERLETMNRTLKDIEVTDQSLAAATNEVMKADGIRRAQEQSANVQAALYEVKRDSAMLANEISKRLSRAVVTSFDALLTYRHTIGILRDANLKNGNSTAEIERLSADLRSANQQVTMLQGLLASKPSGGGGGGAPAPRPAAAPAGGGGIAPAVVEDLRFQLDLARAECDYTRANEIRLKSPAERQRLYTTSITTFQRLVENASGPTKQQAQERLTEATSKVNRLRAGDL